MNEVLFAKREYSKHVKCIYILSIYNNNIYIVFGDGCEVNGRTCVCWRAHGGAVCIYRQKESERGKLSSPAPRRHQEKSNFLSSQRRVLKLARALQCSAVCTHREEHTAWAIKDMNYNLQWPLLLHSLVHSDDPCELGPTHTHRQFDFCFESLKCAQRERSGQTERHRAVYIYRVAFYAACMYIQYMYTNIGIPKRLCTSLIPNGRMYALVFIAQIMTLYKPCIAAADGASVAKCQRWNNVT